jgi:hypothetical protein
VCNPPICPGEGGACCQPNGSTGCDDITCCDIVCADDYLCCDPSNGWDSICVGIAEDLCGNLCSCVSFGDFDDDGDVSLADFAEFQNCLTGQDAGPAFDGCACGMSDGDDDVDMTDYAGFFSAFNAP